MDKSRITRIWQQFMASGYMSRLCQRLKSLLHVRGWSKAQDVGISVGTSILVLLGLGALMVRFSSCNAPAPQKTPTPTAEPVDIESASLENQSATPVPVAESMDTVWIFVADDVSTLEPYRMARIHPDGSVAIHLWDTLTLLNDDLKVEPHLAESWRLVNNFTWEFRLRQGITFHNGEPLNAEAARYSIERAQSMPGSLESLADDVLLEKVEVVDDYTLRIVTRQPVVNLPFHLAFLEILPPIYYSETPAAQLAAAPIGSGPYRLVQWIPGEGLALEAVPTYWKGTPVLPRLMFRAVPSAEERLAALREGRATLVTDLPPMSVDQWDAPTSTLVAVESTQRMFVGLRVEAGSPLGDKRVRQALNYGINVERISDDWLEGYGERYGSWVNAPSNNAGLAPWPYDPVLARGLLAEAGYREGFTTTLYTPVGVYYQDAAIAETIARQLAEISVTVTVETADWTSFVRRLLADDIPPLFLLGLNSRGDGLEDLKNLSSAFAFNPTGWRSDSFEDKLKQAANTFNESARARIMDNAQSIAYDEAPWIWLWRQYDFCGISQDLDWAPRRDGLVYLYR